MNHKQDDIERQATDYKVNVQIVAFIVVIIVVILTLVYFIRIYSNKKTIILKDMRAEVNLLETNITDHLNYSQYFINLIGRSIKRDFANLEHVQDTLQNHFQSQEFNMLFGWRKYSWVGSDFNELVTSNGGIEKNPRKIEFVEEIVNKIGPNNNKKDNIFFRINKSARKAETLKLINALFDEQTNHFIGAVILSYDIDTMVKSLNQSKKSDNINFVIIDIESHNIVAQSKPEIDKIINKNDLLPLPLLKLLQNLENDNEEVSYLDMINGVNYFIKPLKNLPFAIIVNIDNNFIKNNIVEDVTKKFLEVSFLAGISLIIIISIYKRETSLRTKAERATIIANNATEAKTNFLAFTAHEIRSPLGFILTGSEAMSKELFGPIPSNYTKYVEGIHNNAQVILDFIIDILDEDQIIEGQFRITNSLNKMEDIINKAIKSHLGQKNISILTNFAPKLPLLICDKRRILQVIDNLISNSIKYSKEDTTIRVNVEIQEGRMIIEIADQGIGMKKEEIPLALSKYGTLHKQDYQKGGSYGLGLPIVKMLLDAHEASLEIDSTEGVGTTVKIIFPEYKIVYNKEKK
jgi:signal transduction histidine kinase